MSANPLECCALATMCAAGWPRSRRRMVFGVPEFQPIQHVGPGGARSVRKIALSRVHQNLDWDSAEVHLAEQFVPKLQFTIEWQLTILRWCHETHRGHANTH